VRAVWRVGARWEARIDEGHRVSTRRRPTPAEHTRAVQWPVRRRLDDVGTSWRADANGKGQDGREHGDDDEAAAAARLAPIGLAARETAVKILPSDRRLIAFGGGRCTKKQPSLGHEPGAAPVGEQAVVADADKRAWKHVDEKASYEISRLEDEKALPIPVPTVAIPESDLPVLFTHDAAVRDGDAVRIPPEVSQHLLGPGHRRLAVDHPLSSRRLAELATARRRPDVQ